MADPKSSQIDLRPIVDPEDAINDSWQGPNSEDKKSLFLENVAGEEARTGCKEKNGSPCS